MVFYIVMFVSYANSLGCFISFISHWILPKTALVYNNFITLLIKRFPTSQLWHFLSSRVPLVFNGVRQNYHLPTCNFRSIINAGKAPGGIPNSYCFSFLFLFKRNNWFWRFFFVVVVVTILPNLLLDFYDRDHLK